MITVVTIGIPRTRAFGVSESTGLESGDPLAKCEYSWRLLNPSRNFIFFLVFRPDYFATDVQENDDQVPAYLGFVSGNRAQVRYLGIEEPSRYESGENDEAEHKPANQSSYPRLFSLGIGKGVGR